MSTEIWGKFEEFMAEIGSHRGLLMSPRWFDGARPMAGATGDPPGAFFGVKVAGFARIPFECNEIPANRSTFQRCMASRYAQVVGADGFRRYELLLLSRFSD